MKTITKGTIVWGMILFLLAGGTAGCKGKSEEKEVAEDETVQKKTTKEITIELGKVFTFWQYSFVARLEKESEFQISFVLPALNIPETREAETGKKFFTIVAKVKNLGPRKFSPQADRVEVKVNKGFSYELSSEGWSGMGIRELEPGQTEDFQFSGQIPEDAYPVEIVGRLGQPYTGEPVYTKFRLKLPKELIDSGQMGESKEPSQAEEKVWAGQEIKQSGQRISKNDITGRYVYRYTTIKEGQREEHEALGFYVFNKNQTAAYVLSGKWELKDDRTVFYLDGCGDTEQGSADISGEISLVGIGFTKQEGAKILFKRGKSTVWRDYACLKIKSWTLKLNADGTFSTTRIGHWKMESGFLEIRFADEEAGVLRGGRLQGNEIVFDKLVGGETVIMRFVKQDGIQSVVNEKQQQNLEGTYVFEGGTAGEQLEKEPGIFVFNRDGTITYLTSGRREIETPWIWGINNGLVQILEEGERLFSDGTVKQGEIVFDKFGTLARFVRQDGIKSPGKDKQDTKADYADYLRFPLKGDWKAIRAFNVWSPDWSGRHLGEDIEREPETPVFPMAQGVVKFAKYQPEIGIGYGIIMEHNFKGETFCCVYYHMRQPKAKEALKEGHTVTPDKPIGCISREQEDHLSVPHLHFGIRKGKYLTGKDPRTNKWYYPGYTAIYDKQGVRESNPKNPIHEEIAKEWYEPSNFIRKYQQNQ